MHFLLIVKTGNGHEIEFQMLEMHFFTRKTQNVLQIFPDDQHAGQMFKRKTVGTSDQNESFFAFCLTCQMAKVFSI
jgi:hypothetical protein